MGLVTRNPYLPQVTKVTSLRQELADTITIELEPPSGFTFLAGQFNMLYVNGVGEVPISISGPPSVRTTLIHTIRDVGLVTHKLCAMQPGMNLGVRGPYGSGWPVAEARGQDVVLIAGGLGLAPLRPAIYEILSRRNDYGRIILLVGARDPKQLLYANEYAAWTDLEIHITVDRPAEGWTGDVGVVTKLLGRLDPPSNASAKMVAFVCGPEIMMRFAIRALCSDWGLAESNIYLSMERNMRCAVGLCGHCQFGPHFVCKDGPVYAYSEISAKLAIREL